MAFNSFSKEFSESGALIERHWQELAARRRLYSWLGFGLLFLALGGSLWFANETNAGKFFDRLPHLFDFVGDMVPRDGFEVFRALLTMRPSALSTRASTWR